MAIDRFNRERFEKALPKGARAIGLQDGEYAYVMEYGVHSRIMIRSSVGEDGWAKDTGEDSIRLWAEVATDKGTWKALPKVDAYTTRVNGWEARMAEKIEELAHKAKLIQRSVPTCKKCHAIQPLWFVKAGPNAGRPASKCIQCDEGYVWLDKAVRSAGPSKSILDPKQLEDSVAAIAAKSGASAEVPQTDPTDDFLNQLNALANEAFAKPPVDSPKMVSNANEQQMKAIAAPLDKAIRVLAGPGSGKTFVIERRYAHLLRNGVKPGDIVAVTFSAAMALDLQGRILKHNPEVAGTGAENQICTIHALCSRICVAEGLGKQIPKTWQYKKIVQEVAQELWEYVGSGEYMRPSWDEIARAIVNAKANGLGFGQDGPMYEELWGEYHAVRLVKAREKIDRAMKGQGLWTFSDMVYECEKLLFGNRAVLEKYQSRYKYIIVDEGQDTNNQAMRVLTMLAEPQNQLFIVGDPDQLLYRFTGATPEANLYDGFTDRYPEGQMYMLETNYRSTKQIVEMSNRLIDWNYAGNGGPYGEVFHKILAARDDAPVGKAFHFQQYLDPADEAAGITDQILQCLEEGRKPGDIFVSSRTRAQLGYLEGPLTRAGVPFINITGGSFWQLKHVADVLAYLRLAMNDEDEDSFQRIYNIASADMRDRNGEYCPTRWLGRAFLEAIGNKYDEDKIFRAVGERYAWRNGAQDLMTMMHEVKEALVMGAPVALNSIIDLCYKRYLQHEEGTAEDDSETGKLNDLESVVDIARKFKTTEEFLERVDSAIQAAQDAKDKKWDEYVVLSTIHRLKGMERAVVFGLGWSEGEVTTPDGVAMPYGLLPHTFSLVEPPASGVLNMGGKSRVEDERCMAFVAITRAKEEVYLSGVRVYRKANMWPSRFIKDLGLLGEK